MTNKEIKVIIIVKEVVKFYKLKDEIQLFSKNRVLKIMHPRQVCFYLLKKHTDLTLKEIGEIPLIYGREKSFNHSNVLHNIKSVLNKMETEIKTLKEILELNYIITDKKNDHPIFEFLKKLRPEQLDYFYKKTIKDFV